MKEQAEIPDLSNLFARLEEIEGEFIVKDVTDLTRLRRNVCKASQAYKKSRTDFGMALYAYRAVYKSKRGWMKAAQEIATHLECDERTIRNIVADYERILTVPASVIQAMRIEGLDPAAKKNLFLIDKVLAMIPSAQSLEPDEAALTVKKAIAAMKRPPRGTEATPGELEIFAEKIAGVFEKRYQYVGPETKNAEVRYVFELVNARLRCDVRELQQHNRPTLVPKPKTKNKVSA